MLKVLLVLLAGLGAALYFPKSRAMILERADFIVNPLYEWTSIQEMERVVADLERWDNEGRPFPERRGFEEWMEKRYQGEGTRMDAWGNPYWFTVSGLNFTMWSSGADQIRGSEDDLSIAGQRSRRR